MRQRRKSITITRVLLACTCTASTGLLALDFPSLYDASKNSVVTLTAIAPDGNELRTGTGFFVGDGARIATNYHVIEGVVKVRHRGGLCS
jgi:S1-C subfamily serine protease